MPFHTTIDDKFRDFVSKAGQTFQPVVQDLGQRFSDFTQRQEQRQKFTLPRVERPDFRDAFEQSKPLLERAARSLRFQGFQSPKVDLPDFSSFRQGLEERFETYGAQIGSLKFPQSPEVVRQVTQMLPERAPLRLIAEGAPVSEVWSSIPESVRASNVGRLAERAQEPTFGTTEEDVFDVLAFTPVGATTRRAQAARAGTKYAFNINKPRLGLSGKEAKKLDEVVEAMRPILQRTKGKPLTNEEIIEQGRKVLLLDEAVPRSQTANFSARLQASRNFLRTEAQKKGITPEFLDQLEIVSSQATDAGRRLRAFSVAAENTAIKQRVLRDLQKLGIESNKLVKAGRNVDWNNPKQVTEFYRSFKPASFLERLEEYRYVNMLSSPNTHIVNVFSNFIQTAAVAPLEKITAGGLDWARSRLTGKEQQYFARQGVDYVKGYWRALPKAWNDFVIVLKQGRLTKPDIEFLPTGTSRFHQLYTSVLRLLEGGDIFFRTLATEGELAALRRVGIEGVAAKRQAAQTAEYRIFRQAFDPQGKLGQGGLLQLWDKYNSVIAQLRRLPGGRWIVPFLQTPTNILKQGIEYSPFGVATIPGSREPMVQLSKAVIGSTVWVGAYTLAESGLTTFAPPVNQKAKSEFYAAGLQPYSVKVGDKWVSYSKLGPLSYPIAMAAAFKWAQENGATESELEVAAQGLFGFLRFFADQSYMKNLGDLIEATQAPANRVITSAQALAANMAGQVIPYRSFLGWLTRLVDPIYRRARTFPQRIAAQVPGLSQTVPPHETPFGEPSMRQFPLTNALSPLRVSQERLLELQIFEGEEERRRQERLEREQKRQLEEGLTVSPELGVTPKTDDIEKLQTFFKIDEIVQMPETTLTQKALRESAAFKKVDDVLESDLIDDTQKTALLESIGLDLTSANYYNTARQEVSVRVAFTQDALARTTPDNFWATMVAMRQEVGGKRILSNGVIDELEDLGILTDAQAKYLKKVDFDRKEGKVKISGGGGRVRKLPKFTPRKLKTQRLRIKVPKTAFKPIQIPRPELVRPRSLSTFPTGKIQLRNAPDTLSQLRIPK